MTRLLRIACGHRSPVVRHLGQAMRFLVAVISEPIKAIYQLLIMVAKGVEVLTEVYGFFQRASLLLAGWMVWRTVMWLTAVPADKVTGAAAAVLTAVATLFTAIVALYQWRKPDTEQLWAKSGAKQELLIPSHFMPPKADPTETEGD